MTLTWTTTYSSRIHANRAHFARPPTTLDVDGVVGNFLHESKFIDAGSSFYTTQIGKLGSGMQVHVMGWKDELYRLSLAAQQHGYQGAKVFINSEEVIRVATEVFGKENWFKYLELIYKLPQ